MKIIAITDVHANLPALEAALHAIREEGYDALYHLGDAIAIGPFPAECLDRLLNTPRIHFVMGNHDAWFAHGLPAPQPDWMSDGEVQHQHWTHAQLDPTLRATVSDWPYRVQAEFDRATIACLHYGLDATGRNWVPIIRQPTGADLDRVFADERSDFVLYGHHHPFADTTGRARYLNPGSLGCDPLPLARFTIIEREQTALFIRNRSVWYDDEALFRAFEQRQVPERDFLYRAFYGGRFGE